MLVDNGSIILDLKWLRRWALASAAGGYVKESIQNKYQTSKKIFRSFNQQEVLKNDLKQHSSLPSLSMVDVSF